MISVIDMPGPEESIWWRGKRGFEVGFFPCDCVEVIGDKVRECFLKREMSNKSYFNSFLGQVPHGLNLPHSSATLPHLTRLCQKTTTHEVFITTVSFLILFQTKL